MRWVDEGKFGANELESVRSQTRLSSSSFVVNQQQTVRWVRHRTTMVSFRTAVVSVGTLMRNRLTYFARTRSG